MYYNDDWYMFFYVFWPQKPNFDVIWMSRGKINPLRDDKIIVFVRNHVFHHISAYIHLIIICDTCISMYFDLKNTIMKLFLCPDVYLTLWGTWNIYLLSKNHIFDHISTYTYVKMICDTLVIMYICPLNSFQVLF